MITALGVSNNRLRGVVAQSHPRPVRFVELDALSPLLPDSVALLARAQAEAVRGPCQPWLAVEVAATWQTGSFDRWMCAALVDERVVGAASVVAFHHGNSHLADVEIVVAPSHRRRGIGRELWTRAADAVRAHGADTVVGAVGEPVEADAAWRHHAAAVLDPELTVRIAAGDPVGLAFAAGIGAEQVQTEFLSRLDVPAATPAVEAMLAPLDAEVARHAGDYVVTTHLGLPPAQLRAGIARLAARMYTDPPIGQLDLRPDEVSVDRLEADAATNHAAGQVAVCTLAVHRTSREVAAMSDVLFRADEPLWGEQHDTIVDPAHRGHRLGFAVKAAGLRRLLAEHPSVRHVQTYNALENGPMLAVNRAMGFEPVSMFAICQRKL